MLRKEVHTRAQIDFVDCFAEHGYILTDVFYSVKRKIRAPAIVKMTGAFCSYEVRGFTANTL